MTMQHASLTRRTITMLLTVAILGGILSLAPLPARAKVGGSNGRIVFNRFDPSVNDFQVFIINADGSNERRLLPGIAYCPTWSPDGKKVLVCVANAQGLLRPATLKPDGSDFTLLDNPDPSLNLGCGTWSTRGRLACESWDDLHPTRPAGIFTVRASDGGGLMRVTTNLYGGHDRLGDYSPDGSRIVIGRENPGVQKIGVFVVNADGSGLRQISDWQPDFGEASWSPDGRWILTDNGQGELYVVHPDGTDLHLISVHVGSGHAVAFQPCWSPDGKRIVFSLYQSSTHRVDLFTAKADGSDLRQVTNTPGDEEFANWGARPA